MAPPPPAHKLIPGCGFLVDGFRYAGHPSAKAYLLSHAHSDHYTGLSDSWSAGPIYCSPITARLTAHMLGVAPRWLVPLPLDTPTMIQGVEVTLVDANHCPGAVQFLFRLPDGRRFIHTGDMRFSPALLDNPHVQAFRGCDAIYLDTTYCNPRYRFPAQEESIEYVASTIQSLLQQDAAADDSAAEAVAVAEGGAAEAGCEDAEAAAAAREAGADEAAAAVAGSQQQQQQRGADEGAKPSARGRFKRLYLIATYGIGKERILTAVHDRCGVRLHVADRKHAVMQQLDLPGYHPAELFTTDRCATPVHVCQWGFLGETWPFFRPNYQNMEAYREEWGADEVVGFVPTGWLFEMKRQLFAVRSKGPCSVHLVPYSEHSSFSELQDYVRFLRPHQVVPTVGVDGEDGDKAREKMQKHFRLLVDETASKAKFLQAFHKAASGSGAAAGSSEQRQQAAAAEPAAADADSDCEEGCEDGGPEGQQQPAQQQVQQAQQQQAGSDVVDLLESEDEEEEEGGSRGRNGSNVAAAGTPAQPLPAAGAAAAAAAASGAGAASSDGAGPSDPQLQQLLAVLGEEVTAQQARQLLAAANGNVEAAINGWLDGTAGGNLSNRGVAGGGSSSKAIAGGAGSKAGQAAKAPAASPKPASGGKAAGAKRAAPAGGKGGGGSKRQKGGSGAAVAAGQRSITAFFAGAGKQQEQQPGGREQQATDEPSPPEQQQQQQQQQAAGAPPPPEQQRQQQVASRGAEHQDAAQADDVASTPEVPLAAPPAGSPRAADASGPKPKLVLPPPPRAAGGSGAGASSPGKAFFFQPGGSKAAGGGIAGSKGGREAAVPRDAVALPLDQYEPVAHACWEAGQPTPYLHLARAFEAMETTKKRLRISDVLVNCFRSVLALGPTSEVVQAAYLAVGKIAPDYEGAELNVGGSTVSKAIVAASGVSEARLRELYQQLGDAGDVAQACKRTQSMLHRPAPLTVPGVFAALRQLAAEKGQGAAGRRQRAVLSLLTACRESEPRYLTRTLVQALRVGANWRSVLPALAKAVVVHKEGAKVPKARLDAAAAAATAAFHVCPNLALLVEAMLAHPPEQWEERCPLQPGVPIKPMLAKICSGGLADAARQLRGAPFLAEFKYDGQRAQIHVLPGGEVRVFSRNCEDKSGQFPDVAQQVLAAAQGGAGTLILDAEVVPVDREDANRIRSFQELATRSRTGVQLSTISVPVCIFAFDLLYLDGRSLLQLPLAERRQQLLQALPNMRPGYCVLAQSFEFGASELAAAALAQPEKGDGGDGGGGSGSEGGASSDAEVEMLDRAAGTTEGEAEVPRQQQQQEAGGQAAGGAAAAAAAALEDRLQECLLEAFAAGTEGLMLKSLATKYEPNRRSDHWLKLKRDYCEGLHDTLDLVVIGAWWGNGRKAGWYSPYLMAAYDPETEELQSVCRCMSGFTDSFYKESLERLSATVIPAKRPYYRTDEQPDVWFDAREVWEIRGADLTLSPVHKAAVGRVSEERGIGLRFPRFLRVREDKGPEDATSAEQIADMFHAQTRKVETAGQRLAARQRTLPQVGGAGAAPTAERQPGGSAQGSDAESLGEEEEEQGALSDAE